MNLKNVVKVMNFHSLVRVDNARRTAESFFMSEIALTEMMNKIVYNKNLILDKKNLVPNPNNPVLNIYIGNDYGFCGNFNSAVLEEIRQDHNGKKIIVGEKINYKDENTLFHITKENFLNNFNEIEEIIHDSIVNMRYSEINIIYNRYYSISDLRFVKNKIFPLEFDNSNENKKKFTEDYIIEGDTNIILKNLISLYICCQIRIAECNSWAAENVMRQQVTQESMKKIDEINEQTAREERKERKYKNFQKIIENFRNLKQKGK